MTKIAPYKRSAIVIFCLVVIIFLLTIFINKQKRETVIKNKEGKQYAGALTCAKCHKSIYDTHILTAHYLTSQPANEKYIKGSFEMGKNTFIFNGSVNVSMEKKDSSFYQVEYINGIRKMYRRLDIVTGSGKKGQSFLYWYRHHLFQLPITYFTSANQWSNSPGYPDKAVFNRPITSRCLECHTTYSLKTSDSDTEPEEFAQNQIVYGVDCEKCHGPGAKHASFQMQNPTVTIAKFITDPARFTRKQSLDLCALCHGGRLNKTKPSFEFKAGDALADYFSLDTASKDANNIDVHGNQFGLLAASTCFKRSEMTCTTCHNTHENESGKVALFSKRCMSCHNSEHGNACKMSSAIGSAITKNCIDCHMPEKPSKSIAVLLQGSKTPTSAIMRTHFIKIYPEETEKVLAFMKKVK